MKLTIRKSTTEQMLVEGCRKGDRKAQHELYERLSGKMLGLCRRYIHDFAEAEGVMVSGFMKVFSKIEQFHGDGSFEGWIRRIMVNESLYYLRKNKSMYLEVDITNADNEPDFEIAGQQLQASDLLAMVNELPMGYRAVFNLYAIEGYSHKEIGKMLEINVNTSKSQLSRARILLQKQLLKLQRIEDQNMEGYGKA